MEELALRWNFDYYAMYNIILKKSSIRLLVNDLIC